ncbi:MAG: DUF4832 domain-containing protein [Oscillospiraceae bacterium]|jgi:hypothetical protein
MLKKKWYLILVVLAAAAVFMAYIFMPAKVLLFAKTDEVLSVPYSGYAPDASNEDLCEDTSLVYVEVTLRDIEPQEGVFDFSGIEEEYHIRKWKTMGKHMVLRLVLDCPSEETHCDIPDWLYEKTGDGTFYDNEYGKGYCPDYSNPALIEAHREAVEALASWAEEDGFAAYVEIGSLGHWGEWHILTEDESLPDFPDEEVQQAYVDAYTDAFENAKLLMRRPFSVLPEGAGVYNDMTGDTDDTEEWLSWIEDGGIFEQTGDELLAVPVIWDYAPVGGEFTSGTPMEDMMGDSYKTTEKLVSESHMTFIGPMIPAEEELDEQGTENAEDLLRSVGPRYRVSRVKLSGSSEHSQVTLTITNDGVCPVYFDCEKLVLYITKEDGTAERIVTDIDLTGISQGDKETIEAQLPMSYDELTSCTIEAGIETEEENDRMPLFMSAERHDSLSLIFEP